jgi:hypothetical protein
MKKYLFSFLLAPGIFICCSCNSQKDLGDKIILKENWAIQSSADVETKGAYRLFDFNITDYAVPGTNNCQAVQIFPPKGMDLTITWVDWNLTPPDRGMEYRNPGYCD